MRVEAPGTYVADIVARLFVIPGRDLNAVRATARRAIAAYLNVPVYADFTASWAGANNWSRCGGHGGPVIARAALAAIPDELIDELFLYGTPTQIATRIRDYVEAIVTTPVLAIMPAAREMPPSSIAEIGRAYIGDR
ncbi:hypothetical protein OIE68_08935 [Nocardia vinacea]|uniref:LLM class flavin-dependent oxidoreductase n=1 Tax=Nocardia vinacea TaxID=96468 RepID=UPI002E108581|nr:hypothetical protein OIE68_08935 [Nocardia vinacea]